MIKKIILYFVALIFALIIMFIGFAIFHSYFFDNRFIKNLRELEESKMQIMSEYDNTEFIKLTNYCEESNYQDLLPYSLKMMDSLDIAHYYFFNTYLEIKFEKGYDKNEFAKLDKEERDFLIYILSKGAKAGDDYCREELIAFYKNGIGVTKNRIKADSLTQELGNSEMKF